MSAIRRSYPDFHTRDHEHAVDEDFDGEALSGVLFIDCEILSSRRHDFLILIDGVEHWVSRSALVMRECTATEVGDRGDVSILENVAIAKGLV